MRLGGFRTVVQDIVEDACRVFLTCSTGKLFGTYRAETESLRTIDTLIIACHYLEFIGQRDFIVIVQAVDDGKVDTELVENICVETHLREVCHTQQLISGFARIHQRAQQVEQRPYSQRFAHRTDGFHCRIE